MRTRTRTQRTAHACTHAQSVWVASGCTRLGRGQGPERAPLPAPPSCGFPQLRALLNTGRFHKAPNGQVGTHYFVLFKWNSKGHISPQTSTEPRPHTTSSCRKKARPVPHRAQGPLALRGLQPHYSLHLSLGPRWPGPGLPEKGGGQTEAPLVSGTGPGRTQNENMTPSSRGPRRGLWDLHGHRRVPVANLPTSHVCLFDGIKMK